MIGRDLLVGIVAGSGERQRNMYLPAGTWYDYISNTKITSNGEWINDVPLWRNGVFTLLPFTRVLGRLSPKCTSTTIPRLLTVCAPMESVTPNSSSASTRRTLSAPLLSLKMTVPARLPRWRSSYHRTQPKHCRQPDHRHHRRRYGTYANAVTNRPNVVELVSETQASAVTLNGSPLTQHPNKEASDAATRLVQRRKTTWLWQRAPTWT